MEEVIEEDIPAIGGVNAERKRKKNC